MQSSEPGYSWTLPYSSGVAKLEDAFDSIFLGNLTVRVGTLVQIVPLRKRNTWDDNPDFTLTIDGKRWHVFTADFIQLWWNGNYRRSHPADAIAMEQTFLADLHADPGTMELSTA